MEGFIPFLIILGIILKFAGKSVKRKEKSSPAPKAQMPAAAQPAPEPAAPRSVPMPALSWLLDEEDCEGPDERHTHAEGASHADAQGCVGGSMAHNTHEGSTAGGSMAHNSREGRAAAGAVPGLSAEGRTLPAAIMQAKPEGPGNIAAKAAAEPEKIQIPVERPRFSAQDMRRAVVTSEILRGPLALRGRTARR